MKAFRLFGIVLLSTIMHAIFFACSSDPIIPEVTVEMGNEDYFAKNMDFDSAAGEKTFSFNSNVEWSISVAPTMNGETWCTVTPNSGKDGNNTIQVKVQENTGYDDRNVVLTLTAGSTLTKTITVTQKQKDAILLTTNKFEVEPQGGKINIEVKANVNYEAIISESSKSWISLASKSRGLSTSNLTFDVAETEEYDKREGEIIIKSGDLSETVHVYQTGQEILLLTKNEYPISDKGETIAVELKSNFAFNVQMPEVDWVIDESKSRGVSSHTLYYTILPNETYDSREAEIIFYDKNSSIKDTLKIIQAQKDAIIISKKKYDVKSIGETIEVELNSNIDFDISIENDWIKLVENNSSRALISHKIQFLVLKNESSEERSSQINITDKNKNIKESIIIKQEGKDPIPYLTFTADSSQVLSMSKNVETLEYSVNYNEWEILGTTKVLFGGTNGNIRLRGKNSKGTAINFEDFSTIEFENNISVACSGDIRTLIDYENYNTTDTKMAKFCCLFLNCKNLTSAPQLPITELSEKCYFAMFEGCTSLTNAPELPATTLAEYCYSWMFSSCTSLTNSPKLPATILAEACYSQMFYDCTSLTNAPKLPETTLAEACYNAMFYNCTSLATAPELPATTLAPNCYQLMFSSCTSLTNAPELPATTMVDGCYCSMFSGCTSLTNAPELPATTLAIHCYYGMFSSCTSLINAPKLPATTLAERCYRHMFQYCTSLTDVPELPATTLAPYCYDSMFKGCTSLTNAPELPATTLVDDCYSSMFSSCTSLINAPKLPATTLAERCYWNMFERCISLTDAPELPATTLSYNCYQRMFYGCSNLTTAPELLATTLVGFCYNAMFENCTKLANVTMLGTNFRSSALEKWLLGVSSTGTFTKSAYMNDLPINENGIPNGWTVKNYGEE